MRSPFADGPEEIVPRTLRQLLAQDMPRRDRERRPRPRKTMIRRRADA